jgi:hypothetical protein
MFIFPYVRIKKWIKRMIKELRVTMHHNIFIYIVSIILEFPKKIICLSL